MNKEEKEAIEKIKEELIEPFYYFPNPKSIFLEDTQVELLEKVLNYIDKLQKENEELKEKINKVVLMIDDNYSSKWYDDYETIAGLRDDIYDLLKNKYKGVKDDN